MMSMQAFDVEAFSLLAVAIVVTGLRSFVRVSSVGLRNLWADDYLVVVAIIFYSAETALAYSVGHKAHGLANNSMADSQRLALQPSDPEHGLRVLGSKIQLAGWTTYSTLLWVLKAAMCTFYYRLTKDLEGYRSRIYIGFGLILTTWVGVTLNLFLSCRPFHHMWQIYPDPGKYCYPAISPAVVWTYLTFNVATDIYLIMIPIPMLWRAPMPVFQKVSLIALFGCGLFVAMAAILRVVLLVSDPVNGAQLAGSWAVRETFVAVITTNMPMLFPHIKKWVSPWVAVAGSSETTKTDPGLSNITSLNSWRQKSLGSSCSRTTSKSTGSESQDDMVDDMMDAMDLWEFLETSPREELGCRPGRVRETGIQRQIEVLVHAEAFILNDRRAGLKNGNYTSTWSKQGEPPLQERSEFFLDHIPQQAYKRF